MSLREVMHDGKQTGICTICCGSGIGGGKAPGDLWGTAYAEA